MTDRDFDMCEVNDDCLLEEDSKRRIKQIEKAENQEQLTAEIDKDADYSADVGIESHTVKYSEKEKLLKVLIKHEVLYKVQSEILQFQQGMDSVGGLFQEIMKAPKTMERLLVNVSEKLTFDTFRKLYKVNFSPEGSTNRQLEQDTVYCLESFIMDSAANESGVTLEQLLGFWTGATKIPPLGFPTKLEVTFISLSSDCLPVAHTCGMVLELRRGLTDPDKFCDDMKKAVLWTEGFHTA